MQSNGVSSLRHPLGMNECGLCGVLCVYEGETQVNHDGVVQIYDETFDIIIDQMYKNIPSMLMKSDGMDGRGRENGNFTDIWIQKIQTMWRGTHTNKSLQYTKN